MAMIEITKTTYSVADFRRWQEEDALVLNPYFQRRAVWKPNTKSFFIDTVVRGWPTPIICIRGKEEDRGRKTVWQVIDGQQRLRTLFAYIDPGLLKDYDPNRDAFTVSEAHNPEIAGLTFKELPEKLQRRILSYQLSTHILPSSVADGEVLQMFARLNSSDILLNRQEYRNATYSGVLKTALYEMAVGQLDRWRRWGLFTEEQIARMREAEFTSDLAMNMVEGMSSKTQQRLDQFYQRYEDAFPQIAELKQRFAAVMDAIETVLDDEVDKTIYARPIYFFPLYFYFYDRMYGIGSALEPKEPAPVPAELREGLLKASEDFRSEDLPENVHFVVERSTEDLKRRRTRMEYIASVCDHP